MTVIRRRRLHHPVLKLGARILLLVVFVFSIAAFIELGWSRYLTFAALKERELAFHEFAVRAPLAAIALFAVFAIGYVVFCIPAASVPMMIGGALFGRIAGAALAALSLSIGAILSLLIARFLLRDVIQKKFLRQAMLVDRQYAQNGTEVLIAMRLLPVMPYFLTNLVFGLTPIPVRRFWFITLLGSLPAVFLYASAGTELARIQKAADILNVNLFLSLAGLAVLPFAARWITRRFPRRSKLNDETQP